MTSPKEQLVGLGRAIKRRRVELGHSATEAARLAAVSRNTWAKVEKGERRAEDFIYGRMERLFGWAPGTITGMLDPADSSAVDAPDDGLPVEMVIRDPELIRYATFIADPDQPEWLRRAMWEQMRMWNERAAAEIEDAETEPAAPRLSA